MLDFYCLQTTVNDASVSLDNTPSPLKISLGVLPVDFWKGGV
jgi:hypothetical protein